MGRQEKTRPETYGIPVRVFLFTLDQIATMLDMTEQSVKSSYIYFDGRSTGYRPKDRMMARNIAPDGDKPEWRVAERELIRFMRFKKFRIYDRGWVTE